MRLSIADRIRDEQCIFDCNFLPHCPAITKPGLCLYNNNDSAGLRTWEIEKTWFVEMGTLYQLLQLLIEFAWCLVLAMA